MANNSKSGGFKGQVVTVLTLIVLASVVVGWAKVNHISSVGGVYDYFKSVSDKAWECGAGKAKWECGSDGKKSDKPNLPQTPTTNKNDSLKSLDTVKISDAQTVAYKRSEWKHWIGEPCNTRETVLKEQGKNVKTDPKTCKIVSGTWVDVYSGENMSDASKMDIDHVIPLSYAAQHGGQSWDAQKKQDFANDTSQLLAVSAKENRSKSDKGPAEYMPSDKSFRCEYSKMWVNTASKYGVSISKDDKRVLTAELQKCDA